MSVLLQMTASRRIVAGAPADGPVAASITRYDGASGSAIFRGTIPLPPTGPHAVVNAAGLANKRVLVNGNEPAGGLYIEALEGRHSNGNLKAAYVEFLATCGASETVVCSVVNGTRSVADRTTLTTATERTPRAWQLAPTLFAITNATYLCTSQIAPLPLIPDDDPRIGTALRTYMTTGAFDTMAALTNRGASDYDDPYAFFTRYLTSGNPAFLARGCQRVASNNAAGEEPAVNPFSYYVPAANYPQSSASYPNADAVAPVNLNPIGYANTGATDGTFPESHDRTLSQLMCYWLSGWEYGRLLIERTNAQWFSDFQYSLGTGASIRDDFARANVRRLLLPGIAAQAIGASREVDVLGGNVFRSGTAAWGTEARDATPAQRVARRVARTAGYRDTIFAPPAWLHSLWGVSTAAATGTPLQPNFQLEFGWVFIMAWLTGCISEADATALAQEYANWLLTQVPPPRTSTTLGTTIRCMPYQITDPAVVAAGTGTGDSATREGGYIMMVAHMFALLYAITGNATARDLFDELVEKGMQQFHSFSTNGLAPGTTSPDILQVKNFGQVMHTIRHAAYWRATGAVGYAA